MQSCAARIQSKRCSALLLLIHNNSRNDWWQDYCFPFAAMNDDKIISFNCCFIQSILMSILFHIQYFVCHLSSGWVIFWCGVEDGRCCSFFNHYSPIKNINKKIYGMRAKELIWYWYEKVICIMNLYYPLIFVIC